jgi:DNA (cytosine-5)-methyltransferase 1
LKSQEVNTIKVAELFAGVGGFRVGFENASKELGVKDAFKVVWSNQWEPGDSKQYASKIYEKKWSDGLHVNSDISYIDKIPLAIDLLVGGFPCQDYSVAKSLSQAHGLSGKKGVLWWRIFTLLQNSDIPFVLLENVDRLLSSPSKQRGRDFAIMIASLNGLGYVVEWRVINAADYGFPQKRKRVFIFAYKKNINLLNQINESVHSWIYEKSVFAKAFPITALNQDECIIQNSFSLIKDSKSSLMDKLKRVSDSFNSPFQKNQIFFNSGISIDYKIQTFKVKPSFHGKSLYLRDIIFDDKEISSEYFVDEKDLIKWKEHKGAKAIPRTSKGGTTYLYSEGSMSFPDSLDKAARTIVTGEGGRSPSRFKHIIKVSNGRYRRLIPEELELLNGFEPGHTKFDNISPTKRAFLMGNALVTGIVAKFAKELYKDENFPLDQI